MFVCQKIDAKNDANGNPRRAWMIYDATTGNVVNAINEGYGGRPKETHGMPELPMVNVTPKEYKIFLSLKP